MLAVESASIIAFCSALFLLLPDMTTYNAATEIAKLIMLSGHLVLIENFSRADTSGDADVGCIFFRVINDGLCGAFSLTGHAGGDSVGVFELSSGVTVTF